MERYRCVYRDRHDGQMDKHTWGRVLIVVIGGGGSVDPRIDEWGEGSLGATPTYHTVLSIKERKGRGLQSASCCSSFWQLVESILTIWFATHTGHTENCQRERNVQFFSGQIMIKVIRSNRPIVEILDQRGVSETSHGVPCYTEW